MNLRKFKITSTELQSYGFLVFSSENGFIRYANVVIGDDRIFFPNGVWGCGRGKLYVENITRFKCPQTNSKEAGNSLYKNPDNNVIKLSVLKVN